jgi:[glutamine synthetase] adenylyltransferase / [glutamine synthetase]-adenylyl-L-tyrosine phosphorylase
VAVSTAQLSSLSPGVDPNLIQQHLARLDGRYFARFSPEEIAAHLGSISRFTADRPASVKVVNEGADEVACTVFAFDHPGAFSLIAGVLSSMGYNIRSGDIFTWAAPPPNTPRSLALRRRRIIDHFTGTVSAERYSDDWQQALENRLTEVFAGLERGGEAAATARRSVNEMAARTLGESRLGRGPVLYPVQIEVEPTSSPGGRTRMRVISQDTPFFLFTFATALTLQEVSIEHVTIRTIGGRIEDEFEFVDAAGRAVTDPARVDRIKLSVLLTKQFTTFLESAPDPLAALTRFEQLVKEVIAMPSQGENAPGAARNWLELLSDRDVMRDLAQLLGASTFLWEDFVRSQYEELLPMLVPSVDGKGFVEPIELLPERLEMALAGADGDEDFARRLNEFKDREIYLFDLDHILNNRDAADAEAFGPDFLTLSRRLTALAENVVEAAAAFAWRTLRARFGDPRTVAGLPVRYAIMGLGKMGGVALGYASDIELLFVYSDSGSTAGPEKIDNSEFFDRLVREVLRLVHAKREGIFHIDLRLRPFGAAGPLGCSLETFCTYYARGGPAHSYERLSLVRLRGIGGDRGFGRQVERLRDEMVYSAQSIDMAEVRALRARQVQEKSRPGALNAKFSPGALVDLEYAVQILQVMHGAAEKRLRTPRIHEALEALASIGVLEQSESVELVRAYHFFRHLINGLRMLRGSAQDLFLPVLDSDEYLHLARRMGYAPEPEITPAQKLHLDFETHTAEVRAFVERHFGRDSLSGGPAVTVADIVLSDAVPEDQARATLSEHGFSDTARALLNLRHIGGEAERRTLFARLAILACDVLAQRPDPDMALNNWERFLHALDDPQGHLRQMLSQPMRLEILLSIFSASQFLADTMVRDPSLLDYIGRPDVIHAPRAASAIRAELRGLSARAADRDQWRDALRVMRRREILRIGARDICLGTATQRIMEELSDLADAMITVSLERIRSARGRKEGGGATGGSAGVGSEGQAEGFCVIAFGKLGGRELNYSSDIDLLGLCDPRGDPEAVEQAASDMEALRADLSVHTVEGYAYRVDLRLRPYGSSGQLVYPLDALVEYYGRTAALWELQALLKARPVAGDLSVGRAFLDSTRALLTAPHEKAAVAASIDRLRREALKALSRSILSTTDIKTGLGGLRDVEFLAQGLQLVHAHENPGLLCGGTLPALKGLGEAGILAPETAEQLSGDYLFLRRVEHFLQIYEDRQTHSLPRDPSQLRALARLMLGSGATSEQLRAKLEKRFERIQGEYRKFAGDTASYGPARG